MYLLKNVLAKLFGDHKVFIQKYTKIFFVLGKGLIAVCKGSSLPKTKNPFIPLYDSFMMTKQLGRNLF
jgi:hypothetical protein